MARFVFQLDGLLSHRRRLERQRQRDLALAQRDVRVLEEELRRLGESMAATTQEVRRRLTGRLDLAFLAAHRRYIATMQVKGQALVQRLAAMQPVIESRRAALVAAAKDRKAIEKLRERRKEEWVFEQNRRELAELDEVSQQMFFSEGQALRGEGGA
jgi:flagellar protein FliJ